MTTFKKTLQEGSKNYYSFSSVGLAGLFSIDTISNDIQLSTVEGHYKDDQNEINKILYIAKKKITEQNFPESTVYATH